MRPDDSLATSLLLALHLGRRQPLLSAFLDRMGIPHDEGMIDPDHELVEVLKMKDFTGMAKLTQTQVTGRAFIDEFAGLCQAGGSLVKFICDALEQPY